MDFEVLCAVAASAAERGAREEASELVERASARANVSESPLDLSRIAIARGYLEAIDDPVRGAVKMRDAALDLSAKGWLHEVPATLCDAARYFAKGGDVHAARKVLADAKRLLSSIDAPKAIERVDELAARLVPEPSDAVTTDIMPARSASQRPPTVISAVHEPSLSLADVTPHPALAALVAGTVAMRRAVALATRFAPTDAPMLLTGETGSGKEVFARAIHAASARSARPFVAVNCAAVPATLFESELFGHRRGAFTGAVRDHIGYVREADGGTLLLDEIAELPLETQPKLLRMLQEQKVRPVGADHDVRVDIRLLAATHRDLARAVDEGRFRADLFYRLDVVEVRIPPLRERSGDVLELAARILARKGRAAVTISPSAARSLAAYEWPGNVRELENELERASILAGDGPITERHLSRKIKSASPAKEKRRGTLTERVADFEREIVSDALKTAEGNLSEVARILGVTRHGLRQKMQRLGIKWTRRS
jgi:transcriptional regulator with PAS, ATPase and Fis domain